MTNCNELRPRLGSFLALRYWSQWGSYWAENYSTRLSIPLLLQKHTQKYTYIHTQTTTIELNKTPPYFFMPPSGKNGLFQWVGFTCDSQAKPLKIEILYFQSEIYKVIADYKLCMQLTFNQRVWHIIIVYAPTTKTLWSNICAWLTIYYFILDSVGHLPSQRNCDLFPQHRELN